MGYLILRIQNAEDTDREGAPPPIEVISARAALGESSITGPGWTKVQELLARRGYEVRPEFGQYRPQDWPLTVIAYTSKNREGFGRSGSSLYRLPARRAAK